MKIKKAPLGGLWAFELIKSDIPEKFQRTYPY